MLYPSLSIALVITMIVSSGCGRSREAEGGEETRGALTHTLTWQQPAGSEVVQCHTFKLPSDTPVALSRIRFAFARGSHHVHIYSSDQAEPDGVTDCRNGVSWPRWKLVTGAQEQPLDWKLPAGLSIPLQARQQLMVQVHWLNTTPAALSGSIDLSFHPTTEPGQAVGVMFGINKQVALAPGERRTLRQFCPMPEGSHLVAMMGHFHALGRSYNVDVRAPGAGSGFSIYTGADESTLLFKEFAPAYTIPPAAGLAFECEYLNTRPLPISWGPDTQTQEHCNMTAYYYPATEGAAFCVQDFAADATLDEVAPVTPPSLAGALPLAGTSTELSVTLAAPVESDALVSLTTDQGDAVALPPFVVIPAGERRATFRARALRPTRGAGVVATLGKQQLRTALPVAGLVLSELMAYPSPNATADGESAWVELANVTRVPIDLSLYSLGAGGGSYGATRIPLGGTLPPSGCLVVKGPLGTGRDAAANGVALFDVPPGAIDEASLPMDALVYGNRNTYLLRDATGAAATPVPGPPMGGSLARYSMTEGWIAETVPTPGICEVR